MAKQKKNSKISLSEFRAWLSGVEEMQDDDWAPSKTQWDTIRRKMDSIVEDETVEAVKILNELNVMPALSCGFGPELTESVTKAVGNNYMANVGGAIHGHKDGTLAGALAMRKSIDELK